MKPWYKKLIFIKILKANLQVISFLLLFLHNNSSRKRWNKWKKTISFWHLFKCWKKRHVNIELNHIAYKFNFHWNTWRSIILHNLVTSLSSPMYITHIFPSLTMCLHCIYTHQTMNEQKLFRSFYSGILTYANASRWFPHFL